MHRFRSWILDPPEYRSQRNRLLPIEGGDGSTLNLDFTTGVLDPRLSFSRTSNATFINSSGLVQYADANMVVNADFVGAGTGNSPTTWTGSAGINLSIPATGVRRAETTTAAKNYIQSVNLTTSTGLTYSTSVYVNEVSGQHYTDTLGITGSPTTIGYFRNGSSVNQFATALPGLITVVWTATGTHGIRVGIGSTGADVANAICEFTKPRTVPGNFTQPTFFANSSTTAAYHAPRFDCDPTTGLLKGLLIEGQATNYATALDTPWGRQNINGSGAGGALAYGQTGADGTSNTAARLTTAATTTFTNMFVTLSTNAAGASRTFSVWLRGVGSNTTASFSINGSSTPTGVTSSQIGSPVTLTTSTSGNNLLALVTGLSTTAWTRVSISRTDAQASSDSYRICPGDHNGTINSNLSVDVYVPQVESGIGMSSTIPTGSGQATRNADVCYMANADYGFSTSGGTYLAEWHRGSIITTAGGGTNAFATDYASGRWLGIYTTGASSTGTAGSWSGYLNSIGNAVAGINKMAVSYSSWVAVASGNASLNGGAIVSGQLTLGTTPTYLFVGAASGTSPYNGGGYRDPLNNCVRRIKYWPSVLPNAQLQSLTT